VIDIKRVRLLALAATAVIALLAAADPASASITTTTSALGAGYRSTPADGVGSAKVRFKVPSITCVDDSRFDVLYLGVFGFNASTGDSPTSYSEVFAACNMSLTPSYFAAVFTAGGGFKQLSVAIGDDIVTRLDETGTKIKATVHNLTDDTSVVSSGASARDTSVLLGDFGNNPSIPTFTSVKMTGATVNGLPFAHDPTPVVRERFKWDQTVQISTSLQSEGDTVFVMRFRSNT
jgi:hypothetical protein